ncbi:MAG: sugar phosphate isomerase/epimerase [Acidobacteria bacterium]|nr:sugar phosphate isomerase/epimerase [Acidobacteriota bacterium]
MLSRRTFFLSSFASTVAGLRAQNPKLRLGFDTYSLRAWRMKSLEHLDFAAKHGCNAIQISSLDDFESLDPAHLAKVKAKGKELDIAIDAGTGCICPTAKAWKPSFGDPVENLTKALKIAHLVGARSLRCYLGDTVDRYDGKGIEYHMESTIKVFKGARSVALDTGVKIALENHSGDMQAWEAKTVIEESGKDYVAACLDTGNPIWCAEHPEVTMEVLGPLTMTTHIRDTALFEHPRGCAAHWTVCGEGCVDMKKIGAMQKQLCPESSLHLEVITGRPPRIVPYLEDSFWKGFPKGRASEFARFVSLVKTGHPLMTPMVIEDAPGPKVPAFQEALKMQQMLDLEKSLEYAKKNMI